jgi:hypothetical protein
LSEAELDVLKSLLRVDPYSFKLWQSGDRWPQFPTLLKICYILDLSPNNLFYGKTLKVSARIVRSAPEMPPPKSKQHRSRSKFKPEDYEQALQTALEEDPPVSVIQVLSRLELKKNGKMWRRFPELCAAVTKRYADYRKSVLAKRKEDAVAEVRRVAREMHDAGLPVRTRQICPRLTMAGLYRPEGRAALREIKEELGLE